MGEEFKDPMEFIWEKVPKNQDGHIEYLQGDIPYLYRNGFVDTQRFSFQQWKNAFDDCLDENNHYVVSKEKFLTLRKYRYVGPVWKPFDPSQVREGEWTDAELLKLYHLSLKPSSSISEEVFLTSIKTLKKQPSLLSSTGNLIVNQTVKTQLNYLIERFPSPRRLLEKEVNRIREERDSQIQNQIDNRDGSLFMNGKAARESKLEDFKKLETTAKTKPIVKNDTPSIDIKSLRRPSGKISG